jgi:hypothetical protein
VKLKDTANTSAPQLSLQCKAIEDFHSHQAQGTTENNHHPVSSSPDSQPHAPLSSATGSTQQNKRNVSSIVDNDGDARAETNETAEQHMFFLNLTLVC